MTPTTLALLFIACSGTLVSGSWALLSGGLVSGGYVSVCVALLMMSAALTAAAIGFVFTVAGEAG